MLENAVSTVTFGDSEPYADFSDVAITREVVLHQGKRAWPLPPATHQEAHVRIRSIWAGCLVSHPASWRLFVLP